MRPLQLRALFSLGAHGVQMACQNQDTPSPPIPFADRQTQFPEAVAIPDGLVRVPHPESFNVARHASFTEIREPETPEDMKARYDQFGQTVPRNIPWPQWCTLFCLEKPT